VQELKPDVLVDIATLTGAIKVSLGAMLYGGMFATDDALADNLADAGRVSGEELWRMPLPAEYEELISTPIADSVNSSKGPGSITAALFLKRFVEKTASWAHFDIFAWNPADRPHGPAGGEAQGIRALERIISTRFG